MRNVAALAVALLLTTGCNESPEPPPDTHGRQLGVAGSGVQGGAAGTAVQAGTGGLSPIAGAGSGGSAGAMLAGNAGAAGAGLTLSPAPSVDLTACRRVADDGTSKAGGDCFLCCAGENLVNSGFFRGACACARESADASACVSEPDDAACVTCCNDGSFRGTSFDPGPPATCTCHGHTNPDVCTASGASADDCAVCCINAGYVTSGIDGGCVCSDG
jgi:hypothetical protein